MQQFGDWLETYSIRKKFLTFTFGGGQPSLNIYPPFEFGEGFIIGGINDTPEAPQIAIRYDLVVSATGSEFHPAGGDFGRDLPYSRSGNP